MNTSGVLHWNKTLQVVLFIAIVGGILWFKMSSHGASSAQMEEKNESRDVKVQSETGDVEVKVAKLKITVDGQTLTIVYRETTVAKPLMDILFLHGMAFTSLTWVSEPVKTLQHLCRNGYRSVAIDLPGFGDSSKGSPNPVAFLEAVIKELKLNSPVIVSPSMSGSYALPYLFKDPGNVLSRCRGYVPVAPVSTERYTAEQYQALQLPALVIYGENDNSIGPTSVKNLKNLPKGKVVELKGAGHACYMNKPEKFHTHLDKFLKSLL